MSYIQKRKAEKDRKSNDQYRTGLGFLRRILKQFKLWHIVGDGYRPLPETAGHRTCPQPRRRTQVVFGCRHPLPSGECSGVLGGIDVDGEYQCRWWWNCVTFASGMLTLGTENSSFVKVGKNRFRVRAIPMTLNCHVGGRATTSTSAWSRLQGTRSLPDPTPGIGSAVRPD